MTSGDSDYGSPRKDKSHIGGELTKTFQVTSDYENKLEAEIKLRKYEEKLTKGQQLMKEKNEAKRKKVRDQRGGVPDIQQLRKLEEDRSYGVWEKYLIKTSQVEKSKAMSLRKEAAMRREKQETQDLKMAQIKQNLKNNQKELQEKATEINEKFNKMDLKIDQANQRKMMYSVKHREIENLRFRDFEELR